MLEGLVDLLIEVVLQLIGQALVEFGLHLVAEPFRAEPRPWVAMPSWILFGIVAGGLSVWALPHHVVPPGWLRVVNLVTTPLGAGTGMALLGAWRMRRGDPVLRIDRFSYGFLFAFVVALIRFRFAD